MPRLTAGLTEKADAEALTRLVREADPEATVTVVRRTLIVDTEMPSTVFWRAISLPQDCRWLNINMED